jgi:hypothetical protein
MRWAGLVCALSALITGCAFGNRTARLTYPPVDSNPPPASVTSVALLAPEDQRPEPRKVVGYVRNGLYMHTADVETSDDVVAWVASALRVELPRAGVAVVDRAEGVPTVAVAILKVHSNAYFSYSGVVSLDVTVRRQGVPDSVSHVQGEGSGGVNWASSGDSHADTLAESVRDAARKAALAVRNALTATPPPAKNM